MSNSLQPHELQHARLPCLSPSPGVCSNSRPLSQWCHPTISSCHLLLLLLSIFPSIRVFSNESALRIRWSKYWSFSFSTSPSNEYSGLISFRKYIYTEIVNVTWQGGVIYIPCLLCLQRDESIGICVPLGWDCLHVCSVLHFWHLRAWWILKREEAPSFEYVNSVFIIRVFGKWGMNCQVLSKKM